MDSAFSKDNISPEYGQNPCKEVLIKTQRGKNQSRFNPSTTMAEIKKEKPNLIVEEALFEVG